jgi:hypothetical protein
MSACIMVHSHFNVHCVLVYLTLCLYEGLHWTKMLTQKFTTQLGHMATQHNSTWSSCKCNPTNLSNLTMINNLQVLTHKIKITCLSLYLELPFILHPFGLCLAAWWQALMRLMKLLALALCGWIYVRSGCAHCCQGSSKIYMRSGCALLPLGVESVHIMQRSPC